jgi:8-oxo-dGTP pyrophosphatase MutT (NUDIX family)
MDEHPPRRVAGVCYRRGPSGIELLLVRLKHRGLQDRRPWTFPKGKVEPEADGDDVMALERESKEEAGVVEAADAEYLTAYRYGHPREDIEHADEVQAYLLRVVDHQPGQRDEEYRKPTWFTPAVAREKLAQGRPKWQGGEHARVLDAALERLEAD